jgi:hypothetical protein
MGWPPRASIEHIDRMLVFMGPVRQVACRHQMFGFTPSTSLAGRGEKLGETHELLSWAGGCVSYLILQAKLSTHRMHNSGSIVPHIRTKSVHK